TRSSQQVPIWQFFSLFSPEAFDCIRAKLRLYPLLAVRVPPTEIGMNIHGFQVKQLDRENH
ncbi:MAG: hypothetical protein AAGD22_14845, partial [Verrucomicrobiota bacterium]